jgi:hypothetical protein
MATSAPTSTRTGVAATLVATSISAIASMRSGSCDVAWTMIVGMGL